MSLSSIDQSSEKPDFDFLHGAIDRDLCQALYEEGKTGPDTQGKF
jgi:hypothetical protein